MDRTSYKTAMLLVTSGLSLLVSILPLTWYLGTAAFTLFIWSIYFTFPGTYSTMPAVTTQVDNIIKYKLEICEFANLWTDFCDS